MQSKTLLYVLLIVLMSVCVLAQSLTQDAVSHWTFNETAPTTTFSDSLNYETLTGTPDSGASGELGIVSNALNNSAVYYALTNDSVDVKTAFKSSDFTISLWYYSDDVPAGGTFVGANAGCPSGAGSDGLQWDSDGAGNPRVILGGGVDLSFSKSLLNNSLWNSIILTRNNATATIYVNGQVADTTGATTYNVPNGANCYMRFGAYNDGQGILDTKMDEITFYDRGNFTQQEADGVWMNLTRGSGGSVPPNPIPFPYIQPVSNIPFQLHVLEPANHAIFTNITQVNFTVNFTSPNTPDTVWANLTFNNSVVHLNFSQNGDIWNSTFLSKQELQYTWTVFANDSTNAILNETRDYQLRFAHSILNVGGCPDESLTATLLWLGMAFMCITIFFWNQSSKGMGFMEVMCGLGMLVIGWSVVSCQSVMGYVIMAIGVFMMASPIIS